VAVALGKSVYLWNATTTATSRLVEQPTPVTGVCWSRAPCIVLGLRTGAVHIWDPSQELSAAPVVTLRPHEKRVGTIHCRAGLVATGSRDRTVMIHDPRAGSVPVAQLTEGHEQEVCGVRWSPDGRMLATGGNDNRLVLWDRAKLDVPLAVFLHHTAAVRAIAWSPHTRGLLVSGGGSADRRLLFWSASTLQKTAEVYTGSQVCNVLWSRKRRRDRQHARVLAEPDRRPQRPLAAARRHAPRPHLAVSSSSRFPTSRSKSSPSSSFCLQRAATLGLAGRQVHRHRGRRRNAALLERLPVRRRGFRLPRR
jgi:hypothetical protein